MNLVLGNPSAAASAAALQFAPLGVPLRIECSDAIAVDAVAGTCRGWAGEADPGPSLDLRIEMSAALSGTGRTTIDVDSSALQIRGPGVAARAQFDQGFAHCEVSCGYLEDPPTMFAEVLEPLVLMMLTCRDRTP